jgi:hypothetical protein
LFEVGLNSEVKENTFHLKKPCKLINKSKQAMLENIGLTIKSEDNVIVSCNEYPKMFSGWKALSVASYAVWGKDISKTVTGQGLARLMFMKGLLSLDDISLNKVYGDLEQSGIYLDELENYLIERGYINYFKSASFYLQKIYPDKHEGQFNVFFTFLRKNQLQYDIKIPNFTGLITDHHNEMDDELKEFIFSRTKKCNLCGYCTQIDKTGKRKPLTVLLTLNNETIGKCPFYPNLKWNKLDEHSVVMIKKLIDFSEGVLYAK